MVVLDWLKPAVIFGSILYAFIGIAVLWLSFLLFDKITPYRLWDELCEKKNVARVGPAFISSSPRARRPVPASRISRSPPLVTSMHEVFPPTFATWGPLTATLPRTPQKRMFIGRLL